MAIKGMSQLLSRFEAIRPNPKLMAGLALNAVREQKILAPKKTSNLSRSIIIGTVTDRYAETKAMANYAAYVELGTKAHWITPKRAKSLRFAVGGSSGTRLSGSPRSGAPRASGGKAGIVFTKRVRHPGTKPQPYMLPGAKKAVDKLGADFIVKAWNDAA